MPNNHKPTTQALVLVPCATLTSVRTYVKVYNVHNHDYSGEGLENIKDIIALCIAHPRQIFVHPRRQAGGVRLLDSCFLRQYRLDSVGHKILTTG